MKIRVKNTSFSTPYTARSLERALDLIEIPADGTPEKSLTELTRRADFHLSTTHGILNALGSRGCVKQNARISKPKLTFKFFEITNVVVRHLNLREEATPVLTELARETGESAYLNCSR